MKYTLNLDADLVDRVIAATGVRTRTEAITHALREVDRRARLRAVLKEGTGLTAEELTRLFDSEMERHVAEDVPGLVSTSVLY